jgi:DNA helicase-2/ATP-dependent DNA helicase PcrA
MDLPDFRQALNEEQFVAATAPDGPALVLAAAGTGKTRTLVHRVAFLVRRGIPPDRILLLTFTNRAAREMLERAEALVGPGIGGVWGGTFHHLANKLLRRHADRVGFRHDYTILDRDDSLSTIAACVKDRNLGAREFPKKEVLMGLFSAAANMAKPLAELAEARFDDLDVDVEAVLQVHADYCKRKTDMQAMDFDDLLVLCLALLRGHADVAERYQRQFLHVLVDEYQDTNPLQAEIVDRLASGTRNVLVVGDDFQSIYGWRGADYRNILSFPKRYPDARIYKLETNYRSVPEILAVANRCIAGNPDQFQKTLRATREPYQRPRVFRVWDGEQQARTVVEQIRALRREGYKPQDIAVLYRAHFHAMELQMALAHEEIPFTITSGVRFFEQAHIKDICALFRTLENPGDELAFTRLLTLLPGVGPKSAAKLWQALGGAFHADRPETLAAARAVMKPAAKAAWAKIEAILVAYFREGFRERGAEVVDRFLDAFYETHAVNTYEDAERRLDEIREMTAFMEKYTTVQEFLSEIALLTNADSEQDPNAEGAGTVRLSTVHQAKGLEWPVVILLWMTEGMFPSGRSLEESADAEAEERRLFYVAVTRAKDELLLFSPDVRRMREGGVMPCQPSRFLRELPKSLVHEVWERSRY